MAVAEGVGDPFPVLLPVLLPVKLPEAVGLPVPLGLGEAVCVPLTVAPPVPQALGVPLPVLETLLPNVAEGVGVEEKLGVALGVTVGLGEYVALADADGESAALCSPLLVGTVEALMEAATCAVSLDAAELLPNGAGEAVTPALPIPAAEALNDAVTQLLLLPHEEAPADEVTNSKGERVGCGEAVVEAVEDVEAEMGGVGVRAPVVV